MSSQTPDTPQQRHAIRKQMRAFRQQLTPEQQLLAARQLSQILMSQPWFQRAKNIAMYIANDGEIDPIVVSAKAQFRGRRCLLPSLHPLKEGQLCFADYNGPRKKNKFGISEPDPKKNTLIKSNQLDIVLLPLVAFDAAGGRLGMGGGYYDRTFEFLKRGTGKKPKLIGLAHDFQRMEYLPIESWDVPLDAIVTDKQVLLVNSTSR